MKKNSTIKAEVFDQVFDQGGDISSYVDATSIRRPGTEPRRVNVDFPEWVIHSLDQHSKMIGVSRQSLIKLWVAERLQVEKQHADPSEISA
jgi:hypothetical protein